MKYFLTTRLPILLLCCVLLCAFQPVEEQLLPTRLRVTVIDGLGNVVEGASVSLYEKKEQYLASENPSHTLPTDDRGRVTFKGLKPMAYFIEAKKGDMNNNGEGVQTGKLEEAKMNRVNVVIE